MIHIYQKGSIESTFLLLHGTGGDEKDLIPIAKLLNPGFHILSPRGNVSENGMNRFFKRFNLGNFDIDSVIKETKNLDDFIKTYTHKYVINQEKIIGLGFSNGANILESLIQLYPNTVKYAVLLSPSFIQKNIDFKDLSQTKIFISSSEFDQYTSKVDIKLLESKLIEAGADVTLFMHNYGHTINQDVIINVKKWLLGI